MALSAKSLAARLDGLAAAGAFISEGDETVTVSNLVVDTARAVLEHLRDLEWPSEVFDPANTSWTLDTMDPDFEPFRIAFTKPAAPDGVLRILTKNGFAEWLDQDDPRSVWQVCGLSTAFTTAHARFTDWEDQAEDPPTDFEHCSPRTLVREHQGARQVPANLNRWLLTHGEGLPIDDEIVEIWANKASRALMLSLPDEHDGETRILKFKGPPRLELRFPQANENVSAELGNVGFEVLQAAVGWVFEIKRESEMRHILLATEIARGSGKGEQATAFLRTYLDDALQGAKTAYQVQLAGISSDSLKTLTELRKSVSDETAKLSDAARQIIASVASALAVGVGLLAARLTTATSPKLIAIVMMLAAAYVATTMASGILFMLLQRNVRKAWQPRLYKFLSKSDYRTLVGRPASLAEAAVWVSTIIGGGAVLVMSWTVLTLNSDERTQNPAGVKNTQDAPQSQSPPEKNKTANPLLPDAQKGIVRGSKPVLSEAPEGK